MRVLLRVSPSAAFHNDDELMMLYARSVATPLALAWLDGVLSFDGNADADLRASMGADLEAVMPQKQKGWMDSILGSSSGPSPQEVSPSLTDFFPPSLPPSPPFLVLAILTNYFSLIDFIARVILI